MRQQQPRYSLSDGLRDGMAVTGIGMIAGGCYLVYPPAALIVPGVLLFGLAIWKVR